MHAHIAFARELGKRVYGFADRLWIWQDRRRGRRAVMQLPERVLRDRGLSRCQALAEYEKPFWRD